MLKMSRYFLLLFFFSASLSVYAQKKTVFQLDTFYLGGHIEGWDNTSRVLKIVYSMPYGGQEQVTAELDSAGLFTAAVPLFNPQELILILDHTVIYIYGVPGKKLQFSVPSTYLPQMRTAEEIINFHETKQVIFFRGDAAVINEDFRNYMYRLNKIVNPVTSRNGNGRKGEEYLFWRRDAMRQQLDSLKSFKEKITATFHTYARNYILYSAGADVLANWFADDSRQKLLSSSGQSFIDSIPVNNEAAVLTTRYYEYINNYLAYVQLTQGGPEQHTLNRIATFTEKGVGRNLLLDNEAQDSLHSGLPLHPSTLKYLEQLPGNLPLAERLADLNDQLTGSMSNAMPDKATLLENKTDTTADILQVLGEKYKGKVVYVDFWGPWCPPCMEEMKQMPALRKTFEDKPVVFLYLAIHTSAESWEQGVRMAQIQGEHYRVSEKEFDQLNKRIAVTSFPRYLLIDKNGMIRLLNAPRPDNPEAVIDAINKLLN